MGKIKDWISPSIAGLEYIDKSNINPLTKLQLLTKWHMPRANRKDLKRLREVIREMEQKENL